MTIISKQKLQECQDFVDKFSEIRFNKVKLRQLNKLNLLTIRKEGNITRSNNTRSNNTNSSNITSCNLNNSQVNQNNSQANAPQGRNQSFPGKYPPQVIAVIPREGITPSQASIPLPGEASTSLATALPPREASTSPATASTLITALPPLGEGSNSSHSVPPCYSLRSTQAGQASNKTRAVRQGNRCPPIIALPRLPRRSLPPPGKVTSPAPPSRPPMVLLMRNLTLSGS